MSIRHAPLKNSLSVLGLVLAALLASCTAPIHRIPPDDGGAYGSNVRASGEIPAWAHQELSWNKLREIERWSGAEGLRASDHWRTEAMLVAAEGRLVLARRETENTTALNQRLSASRRAFESVRSSARSSEMQRNRARNGIERIGNFGTPMSASSPRAVQLGSLVTRGAWGARTPIPGRMYRAKGPYYRITVHHSADTVSTQLNGSMASSVAVVKKIQNAHMNGENTGWGDLGYHFLIDPQGRVFEGRSLEWQGAHASGKNNVGNVGICLLGNFENSHPTERALGALESLVNACRNSFGIAKHELHGHNEYKNTQCPGKHLTQWLRSHR